MPQHSSWLRALFEQAPEGMVHAHTDGRMLDANPAVCSMLGYRHDELLTRTLDEISHPDDRSAVRVALVRMLGGGTPPSALALRLQRKDGSALAVNLTVMPLQSAESNTLGVAAIIRENAGHVPAYEPHAHKALDALLAMAEALVSGPDPETHAEQLYSSSEAMARRIAELTQSVLGCRRVAVVALDPDAEVQRTVAAVGLAPDEERRWRAERRQDVRLSDWVLPEAEQKLRAGEVALIDRTRPPLDAFPNPNNVRVLLVAPMRVRDQMVGLLTLDHGGEVHDYTPGELALAAAVAKLAGLVIERERLLREREEARGREVALEEANQRMAKFLSIASHELKTPLAVIKTNVQLAQRILERRWPNAARQDAATSFAQATEAAQSTLRVLKRSDLGTLRLQRLVDELLDVSRIREGRLEFHMAPCDLAAIVRDAVEHQRQVHAERSIHLAVPPTPIPVIADGDRVGQVVTNYVSNALKYSPPDQPVDVRMRVENGMARVDVRDEGPGLPPSERDQVWEMFYRAPSVDVQAGSGIGMGLGLHISRTIIERHGGQVGVESAPGEGATFWFTLSLA